MAKSPLMVPGAESAGLVAPSILRPVTTAFFPSQTMATTGPGGNVDDRRGVEQLIYIPKIRKTGNRLSSQPMMVPFQKPVVRISHDFLTENYQ